MQSRILLALNVKSRWLGFTTSVQFLSKGRGSTPPTAMPRFKRGCLDCGALSYGDRCPTHQAMRNLAKENKRNTIERQAKKKALYGGDYQSRRRAALANATHCHLCKKQFVFGDAIEADHLIAGDPYSPLAPAHRLCNQSRGDRPLT